jgi:hypothetical protein
MIDWFALFLIHGLLAYTAWHLQSRDDLDLNAIAEREDKPIKDKRPNA